MTTTSDPSDSYSHLSDIRKDLVNPKPSTCTFQITPLQRKAVGKPSGLPNYQKLFTDKGETDDSSKFDDGYVLSRKELLAVDNPSVLSPCLSPPASKKLPFSSQSLQDGKTHLKNIPPPVEPQTYLSPVSSYNSLSNSVIRPSLRPSLRPPVHQQQQLGPQKQVTKQQPVTTPTTPAQLPDYEELPDYEDIPERTVKAISPQQQMLIKSPTPPPRKRPFPNSPGHYQTDMKLASEQCVAPNQEYITSSDEMTLGEFISKHQNSFPVCIRVSRGFYGTSDHWSISEDEYFNVHFIKKTKMVSVWDGCFGAYSIPINSSAKFGHLYIAEGDDVSDGIKGYEFPTVADLLELANPPMIVKVQSNFINMKSKDQSVYDGDLLLIQRNKGWVTKTMKCLEIKSGSQKMLHMTCKGNFTTRPKETQLFLPEIIEHFELPANFMMFINTDSISSRSQEMSFSHRVQLKHCSIETSLIAKQLDQRISGVGETLAPAIVEIPVDLDIGVELVKSKDAKASAQLVEETEELYDTLDIATIQTIPSNIESLSRDPEAAEALITCNSENKNVGIEIKQPPRYSKANHTSKVDHHLSSPAVVSPAATTPLSPPCFPVKKSKSAGLLKYQEVPSAIQMKMNDLESLMDEYATELEQLKASVLKMQRRQDSLHTMHSTLQQELNRLNLVNSTPALSPANNDPPSSYSSLRQHKRSPSATIVTSSNSSRMDSLNSTPLQRKRVNSLTTDEVLKLLRALGLPQYQPLFHSNSIDGNQLLGMRTSDLKRLGVAEAHFTCLMNVIEGSVSLEEIF